MSCLDDLKRVDQALERASAIFADLSGRPNRVETKASGDPVTEAERKVNAALRAMLPRRGEGWLSEESLDDTARLAVRRIWVVDPLDGTREFVAGLPEWSISIALVEDGQAVVGGVRNPATGETIIGAVGHGVTYNRRKAHPRDTSNLAGAEVLASRTEFERGEWAPFMGESFRIRPCGSVAYKLALVAAGRADATWTLVPKHEWDVAAGVALVRAAKAEVWIPGGAPLAFNRMEPKFPGLAAAAPGIAHDLRDLLKHHVDMGIEPHRRSV